MYVLRCAELKYILSLQCLVNAVLHAVGALIQVPSYVKYKK